MANDHDHSQSHGHGGHSHGSHGSGAHSHSHDHGRAHAHGAVANIKAAFFLNGFFALVEFVGGFLIGSVAVMAGAIHDFGDSVSLGTAWWLEHLASRKKDRSFNFGYRRFSLLSAMLSGVVISVGSIIIVYESTRRFNRVEAPASWPMMGLAVLGLLVNGAAAFRLSRGKTQNERVLTWHLIEDVLSWAVVLVGAVGVAFTHVSWIDPALAIGLALFVLLNVLRNLKNTIYLFLQGRPSNFSEEEFLRAALAVPGVEHVDHLAVWSLDGEMNVLSARLHLHSVRDPLEIEKVKQGVREIAFRHQAQATLETCLAEQAPDHDAAD